MFERLQKRLRARIDKWVFRIQDAEPGEVFLNQRRVFIVPTRAGLVFMLMLFVMFLGSVNYNLSLGFVLTFMVAGCAVIAMHLTFRNLAHLHLAAGRAHVVYAGAEAQFELRLINRRKHDRYALWIGFISPNTPELDQAADVAAHATVAVTLSTPATRRGWLATPRVRLSTRFPLGLFRAWSYWQPDVKALIYPRPEDHAPPLPMEGATREDGHGSAGHDDFAGVRAYQTGDAMKHLAWRQIARVDLDDGGVLVTKHFEGGVASDLCLDFSKLPRSLDLELRLSRMTRWVIEAEAQAKPYAFRLGDIAIDPSLGAAHQESCLRALALYEGM